MNHWPVPGVCRPQRALPEDQLIHLERGRPLMLRAACLGPAEPHARLTAEQGARQQGTGGPTPAAGLARAPHLPAEGAALPLRERRPLLWASLSLGVEGRHGHPLLSCKEPNYGGQLGREWGGADGEAQRHPPLLEKKEEEPG